MSVAALRHISTLPSNPVAPNVRANSAAGDGPKRLSSMRVDRARGLVDLAANDGVDAADCEPRARPGPNEAIRSSEVLGSTSITSSIEPRCAVRAWGVGRCLAAGRDARCLSWLCHAGQPLSPRACRRGWTLREATDDSRSVDTRADVCRFRASRPKKRRVMPPAMIGTALLLMALAAPVAAAPPEGSRRTSPSHSRMRSADLVSSSTRDTAALPAPRTVAAWDPAIIQWQADHDAWLEGGGGRDPSHRSRVIRPRVSPKEDEPIETQEKETGQGSDRLPSGGRGSRR